MGCEELHGKDFESDMFVVRTNTAETHEALLPLVIAVENASRYLINAGRSVPCLAMVGLASALGFTAKRLSDDMIRHMDCSPAELQEHVNKSAEILRTLFGDQVIAEGDDALRVAAEDVVKEAEEILRTA